MKPLVDDFVWGFIGRTSRIYWLCVEGEGYLRFKNKSKILWEFSEIL